MFHVSEMYKSEIIHARIFSSRIDFNGICRIIHQESEKNIAKSHCTKTTVRSGTNTHANAIVPSLLVQKMTVMPDVVWIRLRRS
jgi:hypothetical protein